LESALVVLPLTSVLVLVDYVENWISSHQELLLSCRILFFLLKIHQVQISANKALLEKLYSLREKTRQYLEMHCDIMNFNLAAMDYMRRQFQQNSANDFWRISNKLNKKKMAKAAEAKTKNYWELTSSDEEHFEDDSDDNEQQ